MSAIPLTPPISTRRRNPLTDQYILVSPQRMSRPWSQQTAPVSEEKIPEYEPNCNLCPGNSRTNGEINPAYTSTFMFENDFPALTPLATGITNTTHQDDFFTDVPERGLCEVMCFSPQHNVSFLSLPVTEIAHILTQLVERYRALSATEGIRHIQIFETRGKEVGNSAPHPHCQIWSQESIPTLPQKILTTQHEYYQTHQQKLLLDYVTAEVTRAERVITQVGDFVLLVPFWAEWPYELYILPTTEISSIDQLSTTQITDLAHLLSQATRLYAAFFGMPINGAPYMLSFSQKPTLHYPDDTMQLFLKFICPMLTSTRQKYQAGYEKSAEPQRDITPELAATQLKKIMSDEGIK